jgi:hypothetical protein
MTYPLVSLIHGEDRQSFPTGHQPEENFHAVAATGEKATNVL